MILYVIQRLLQTLLHVFVSDEHSFSNWISGSVIYGLVVSEIFENEARRLPFDSLCTLNVIVRLYRTMPVHKTRHIFNFCVYSKSYRIFQKFFYRPKRMNDVVWEIIESDNVCLSPKTCVNTKSTKRFRRFEKWLIENIKYR